MTRTVKRVGKPLYYFSMLTWLLNMILIVISFFFGGSGIWLVAIFASVFIQGIASGAFSDETAVPQAPSPCKILDHCLLVSKYFSGGAMTIGFLSILIGGGGPEVVDGVYCLVNHGDIVRTLSEGWFLYFSICELAMFFCGMLFFSTYMAMRVRGLYRIQNAMDLTET